MAMKAEGIQGAAESHREVSEKLAFCYNVNKE
jgi:hypothetical protein